MSISQPTGLKFLLRGAAFAAAALTCSLSAHAASLTEGFGTVLPAGWTATNNSTTIGSTGWFQGNDVVFEAQAGPTTSYAGANFNSTTDTNTISNWLIAPTLSFNNGDVVSFWTRTVDIVSFPDRLELRFSSVGGMDVGDTPTSVGTFDLLLIVNPSLTLAGYPNVWTQYTSTISGLSGATNAAIAFRYFVTSGGPTGNNSDYIGIDTVSITPVPEPGTYAMLLAGLAALGGIAARRRANPAA